MSEPRTSTDSARHRLGQALEDLLAASGRPGAKKISAMVATTGQSLSHTAVLDVLRRPTKVRWRSFHLVVSALGGDSEKLRDLWMKASDEVMADGLDDSSESQTVRVEEKADSVSATLDSSAITSMISALENSPQAVVVLGGTLIVKYKNRVIVREVSSSVATRLNSDASLSSDPLAVLRLIGESEEYEVAHGISPVVDWSKVGPVQFEDLMKRLLYLLYPAELLEVFDGSGGDGGRDAVLYDAYGGMRIFEFKSFSGRLTGSRRRQIETSLGRASEWQPAAWILLAPTDLTRAESMWFGSLRSRFNFPIEFRGRAWIDAMFAQYPELVRSADSLREQIVEAAGRLKQEEAVLARGAEDLISRVENLRREGGKLSTSYDLVPSVNEFGSGIAIHEKRADIPDEDRIKLSISFNFPETDAGEKAREEVESAINYGGSFDVPPEFLRRVVVSAPAELGIDRADSNVRIIAKSAEENEGLPILGVIRCYPENASRPAALPLMIDSREAGLKGHTLRGHATVGPLEFDVRFRGDSKVAELITRLPLPGKTTYARDLVPILRWRAAQSSGGRIELQIGDLPTLEWPGMQDADGGFDEMADFMENLATIQEQIGPAFPAPANWTRYDEDSAQKMVDLLNGKVVTFNDATVPLVIDPEKLLDAPENLSVDGFAVAATSHFSVTICENKFRLSPVVLYSPRMSLVNREEVESARDAGKTEPVRATLHTIEPLQVRVGVIES